MTRLSRRDRAALVLAYECLRTSGQSDPLEDAERVLWAGIDEIRPCLAEPLHDALCASWRAMQYVGGTRLLRCRLALLLRAILRADAGDLGPMREGPKVLRRDAEREACAASHGGWVAFCCAWEPRTLHRLRYVPLWEQARRA